MTIQSHELGPMDKIREGSFGAVYELTEFHLPDVGNLAYKQLFEPSAAAIANLERLVAFRDGLISGDRSLVDTYFAWPIDTVTKGDRVVGFVMELLTDQFFHHVRLTDEYRPRDAQWLIASSEFAPLSGVEVPEPGGDLVRLVLCAQLARALALLHRAGVVYGDLHSENVVFMLHPRPQLKIVDCDGAKAPSTTDLKPQHQSQWRPPEGGDATQTIATDCYKLGLFVLRCLADGMGSSATRDVKRAGHALGPDGPAMLTRAVGKDPSRRPTAKDWFIFLRGLINERTQPPRIEKVEISEEVVRIGARITVSWRMSGALSLELVMSDGVRQEVSQPASAGSLEVAVSRPGPVELVATNQYGSVSATSRVVSVVSPPTIEFVRIPEPPLPSSGSNVDRALIGTVTQLFDVASAPAPIRLPPLPDVVHGPERAVPSLSHGALTADIVPLTQNLGAVVEALTEQSEALTRNAYLYTAPTKKDAPS